MEEKIPKRRQCNKCYGVGLIKKNFKCENCISNNIKVCHKCENKRKNGNYKECCKCAKKI